MSATALAFARNYAARKIHQGGGVVQTVVPGLDGVLRGECQRAFVCGSAS